MKKIMKFGLTSVAVVSLLALPGAVYGFQGCDCQCEWTPSGCEASDRCFNNICNYNGGPCIECN